jgi:hypothetical protein
LSIGGGADRRDTELAQIPPVSRRRNLVVNVVVVERGRILFEPEAAQLFGHIHRNSPKRQSLGNQYHPGAAFSPDGLWSAKIGLSRSETRLW